MNLSINFTNIGSFLLLTQLVKLMKMSVCRFPCVIFVKFLCDSWQADCLCSTSRSMRSVKQGLHGLYFSLRNCSDCVPNKLFLDLKLCSIRSCLDDFFCC